MKKEKTDCKGIAFLFIFYLVLMGVALYTRIATPDIAPEQHNTTVEKVYTATAEEAKESKRYDITDAERREIASAVTAEAEGEPFAGKVAVAQCILQACEDDGISPDEALTAYGYSKNRPEPTAEALEAVEAVFDHGYIVTNEPIKYFYSPDGTVSEWHESQVFILEINNHRFFKEA